MHSRLAIAALLAAILVFGCASPAAPANQSGGQGSPPPGQQGTQPGGQGGAAGQPGAQGGGGGQGSNSFAGKNFEQLMALGVPMQCNIKMSGGEVTTTAKVYKGAGNDVRTEMASETGPCPVMVSIIKDDRYYIGCKTGEIFPGCQWLVFKAENGTAQGAGGGYVTPDYSSAPASDISCEPWLPDAGMFSEPANACSLEDLMKVPEE